jgi:hypothetical protein
MNVNNTDLSDILCLKPKHFSALSIEETSPDMIFFCQRESAFFPSLLEIRLS